MSGSAFFHREKVLILRVGFRCIALESVGAGETKMGESADWRVQCDAAMVNDILELDGCSAAVA